MRDVRVPWADPRSRFTLLFERFAIDVLWETDVLGASRILDISWDEAHGIMARAVERGLLWREHRVPDYVGIDEKAIARGQRYATIVCDLQSGHVIEVATDRTKESLVRCLGGFSLDELSQLKAVAMDIWDPYIRVMRPILGGREDIENLPDHYQEPFADLRATNRPEPGPSRKRCARSGTSAPRRRDSPATSAGTSGRRIHASST